MKSVKTINMISMSLPVVLLLLTGLDSIAAGEPPMGNIAIKEYDPVAYFKDSKAMKGKESFTFLWHGMTWYFLTKENRDLFAASRASAQVK